MKRKWFKIGVFTLIVVILVGSGLVFWLKMQLQKSVPLFEGQTNIEGLTFPVTVYRDSMGIPQIFAQTEADAYFTLGYLHAADRLFQIDLTRRVATGRLSELLGRSTLAIDRYQRMIGHYRLAQKFVHELSSENRKLLQAYLAGINERVRTAQLPFEYWLLQKKFTPYTIEELLSVLSFQTWFSNFLRSSDGRFVKILDQLGREKAKNLITDYPLWAPLTVPQPSSFSFAGELARFYFTGPFFPLLMAHSSNSWVVSPAKSKSGFAMLASDPHLEVQRLPQFWYLCGLHVKNSNLQVLGISTPGLPFTVMGHNGQAAWAFTVGGIDVSEVFREKRHPQDSTLYFNGQQWYHCQIRTDTIWISGQKEPYILKYKQTENGPIIWSSDSLKQDYSLHWAGFDMNLAQTVQAAFHLAQINNFEDFRHTVTQFGALDANWTYADREGNIGYQLGTPIPIRPFGVNKLPIPAWIDSLKWRGFYPLDQTPFSFNPAQGWLATCNNKQDEANLSYPLRGEFAPDRILRITELLKQNRKFGLQDMKRFQFDRIDRYHQRWQKILIELLQKYGHAQLAARLKNWNGSLDPTSELGALVMLFTHNLKKRTLHDELGPQLKFLYDYEFEQIYRASSQTFFDDVQTQQIVETKEEIEKQALQATLEQWQNRPWGHFVSLTMSHPFARVPGLSWLLPLKHGPFPWGGSAGTLNAAFLFEDAQNPGHFKVMVGPSWRFLIDFRNPDAAQFVLPAGISGNPLSPYFFNFFHWWQKGKYWTIPLTTAKVKQQAKFVLTLDPLKTETQK